MDTEPVFDAKYPRAIRHGDIFGIGLKYGFEPALTLKLPAGLLDGCESYFGVMVLLSKPNDKLCRFRIDFTNHSYLMALLLFIILVDANLINPECLFSILR